MKQVQFESLGAEVKGYLWDDYETLAAHKTRPAMVICPGGAYRWRSPREKDSPALEFLSMGYQVFVLEYSCGTEAAGFKPLRQLAGAVAHLRANHEAWQIDPEKIGDVVGQRGKTINAIIDETGVKIDITDDGAVSICGTDQKMMDKAIHYIQTIVTDYKEGQIFTGKVVSIKEFGAFIEFAPGKEGMVHISKIAKERINRVEDVLTLGDEVKVICMGKDKMGRMSFSIKDVPADEK